MACVTPSTLALPSTCRTTWSKPPFSTSRASPWGCRPASTAAHAIEELALTVRRGEIVCVVGESGSGKSVTAHAVMGLLPRELPVKAGSVLLEGENLLKASNSRLRDLRGTRMAMIYQEPLPHSIR